MSSAFKKFIPNKKNSSVFKWDVDQLVDYQSPKPKFVGSRPTVFAIYFLIIYNFKKI